REQPHRDTHTRCGPADKEVNDEADYAGILRLDDVAEPVHLDAGGLEPADGPLDGVVLAADLAHDPAEVLLDVGPADVGHHVELAHHAGQQRLAHEVLGERQLHAHAGHGRSPFRFPERKPSRSRVTYRYPAPRTAATICPRRTTASGRSSTSNSRRATSP